MSDYVLYWGKDSVRTGWFLQYDDKVEWVHGPSICESSGGGPVASIKSIGRYLPNLRIEIPPHLDIHGFPCVSCLRALKEHLDQAK